MTSLVAFEVISPVRRGIPVFVEGVSAPEGRGTEVADDEYGANESVQALAETMVSAT